MIVIATIIKNNKEVIEEDLKNNSILPLEYHYFYYAHSEGPKWLAIKDDISVLGTAHYKSKYPEAGVKAVVVSYAIEINWHDAQDSTSTFTSWMFRSSSLKLTPIL